MAHRQTPAIRQFPFDEIIPHFAAGFDVYALLTITLRLQELSGYIRVSLHAAVSALLRKQPPFLLSDTNICFISFNFARPNTLKAINLSRLEQTWVTQSHGGFTKRFPCEWDFKRSFSSSLTPVSPHRHLKWFTSGKALRGLSYWNIPDDYVSLRGGNAHDRDKQISWMFRQRFRNVDICFRWK